MIRETRFSKFPLLSNADLIGVSSKTGDQTDWIAELPGEQRTALDLGCSDAVRRQGPSRLYTEGQPRIVLRDPRNLKSEGKAVLGTWTHQRQKMEVIHRLAQVSLTALANETPLYRFGQSCGDLVPGPFETIPEVSDQTLLRLTSCMLLNAGRRQFGLRKGIIKQPCKNS